MKENTLSPNFNFDYFLFFLQIVPMSDEKVFNQMNCFAVNGSQDSPIDVQPILPDLSGFELKGSENINHNEFLPG